MAKDKAAKAPTTKVTAESTRSEVTPSPARLSEVFKALGEPTRVAIVSLLQARGGEPLCVGDICLHLTHQDKAFSSTVSHHLKELRSAGIVLVEKRGKTKLCRLAPAPLAAAALYLCPQMRGMALHTNGGAGDAETAA